MEYAQIFTHFIFYQIFFMYALLVFSISLKVIKIDLNMSDL